MNNPIHTLDYKNVDSKMQIYNVNIRDSNYSYNPF